MLRRQSLIFTLLMSTLAVSSSALATGAIYKWVDQNGVTQYTQTPPPKNAKNSQTVRVSTHIPADVREGRARGMANTNVANTPSTPSNAQSPTDPQPAENGVIQQTIAPPAAAINAAPPVALPEPARSSAR